IRERASIMQRLQRPDHLLACERQTYRVAYGLGLAGSMLECPCMEFVRINDQVLAYEPAHGSGDYTLSRRIIHTLAAGVRLRVMGVVSGLASVPASNQIPGPATHRSAICN